ncbi:hypothetical protein CBR_g36605 [Chara braunii]|uniref:Uncharacterized protein n=1 Tax=Chara braunii TaxID=69332 RepID=A0A388JZ97_CHABU|nr:hypothetical protein CBR_g36605 [Chara braunii]|eukprot:GBG63118.1 hypothetical protein CBR_g36605 [Chara braunii]
MPRRIPEFLDTLAASVNGYQPVSQLGQPAVRVKKTKVQRRATKQDEFNEYVEGSVGADALHVSDGTSCGGSLSPQTSPYEQVQNQPPLTMPGLAQPSLQLPVPSLLAQNQQQIENDSVCFVASSPHGIGDDDVSGGLVVDSGGEVRMGEEEEEEEGGGMEEEDEEEEEEGVISNGEGQQGYWEGGNAGIASEVEVPRPGEEANMPMADVSGIATGISNGSGQGTGDVEMGANGMRGMQQDSLLASMKTEGRVKRKVTKKIGNAGTECGASPGDKKRRLEDRPQPTAASSRVPAAALSAEDRLARIRNLSAELKKAHKTIARLRLTKEASEKELGKAQEILQAKPLLDKINATSKVCMDNGYPDVIGLICDAILSGSLPIPSIRFERLVTLGINCNKEFTNQLQYSEREMRYFASLKRQSCAAAVLEAMRGPMNAGGGHGRHAVRSARITEFVPSLKAIERFEKQMQMQQQQQQQQQQKQQQQQNSQQPEEVPSAGQQNQCGQQQAASGSVGSGGNGEGMDGGGVVDGVIFDSCANGMMMGPVYDGNICPTVGLGGGIGGKNGSGAGAIVGCNGAALLTTASSSPGRALSAGAGSQTGGHCVEGVHLGESEDEDEVRPLPSSNRTAAYPNPDVPRGGGGLMVGMQPGLEFVHDVEETKVFDCIPRPPPPVLRQDQQQPPPQQKQKQKQQQQQQQQASQQQQQQQASQHQACVGIQAYEYLQVPGALHGLGIELDAGMRPPVALQTTSPQQQPPPQQVSALQFDTSQIQVSGTEVCIATTSGPPPQQQHEEKPDLRLFHSSAQLQQQQERQQQQQQAQQRPEQAMVFEQMGMGDLSHLQQLSSLQAQMRQLEAPVQLRQLVGDDLNQFDHLRVEAAFGECQMQAEEIAQYNSAIATASALSSLSPTSVFNAPHEQRQNPRQQIHEAAGIDLRSQNYHSVMPPFDCAMSGRMHNESGVLGLHSPLGFPPYLLTATGQDLGRFGYPSLR